MFSRTRSSKGAAASELDQRLELVEGGGDELCHTPSVAADLATGMDQGEAARQQRLREQLRLIEAELADAKAQLIRYRLLRGPSGERYTCDADCLVGGCQEEFAEEDGVHCASGCGLFLCHQCFGTTVVMNECQQTGRFDKTIESGSSGLMSAPGSLPCPNYPSQCSCAHIAIAEIQRALLHPSNRGADGVFEDLESPGLSPHKVFLMARRRQAETKLSSGDRGSAHLRESTLVRTVTEARQISSTLGGAVGLTRTRSSFRSGARAALADKMDELEQLRFEIGQLPEAVIPNNLRRICAQCCAEFTAFEGAQCVETCRNHFLCNVCFGGFLMKACARGGVFEQALTNSDGMVVSPAGKLPCPFFRGNPEQQLVLNPVSSKAVAAAAAEARSTNTENPLAAGRLPSMDCNCGVIDQATIERALMDPRNASVSFWRERKGNESIDAQAASSGVQPADQAESGQWSWGVELLARGWTPSSVHETARLRLRLQAEQEEDQRRAGLLSPREPGDVDSLADLYQAVSNALSNGATMQCPSCGVQATKDDACVHMDSCPCGSHWCFLCRRISGSEPGQCPRGAGGCDEASCYLESHEGWGGFAIRGESRGAGAREEFLRRRQAYYVRQVMENTDPQLWAQLREKSPGLLVDVPTPGRKIDWDEVPMAAFPLFGANVGREDISDLINVKTEVDTEAAARFQGRFREELEEQQRVEQEARRRRREKILWISVAVVSIVIITAWAKLTDFENPQRFGDPTVAPGLNAVQNETVVIQPAEDESTPEEDPDCTRDVAQVMTVPCQCGLVCDLMFWVPMVELLVGILCFCVAVQQDIDDLGDDPHFAYCLILAVVCMFGWPIFTGPLANAFVAYLLGPLCIGAGITFFASMTVGAVITESADFDYDVARCMMTVGFWGYVGLTWYVRDLQDEVPGTEDINDEMIGASQVEYECTAACVAMLWVLRSVSAAGCFAAPLVLYQDWDDEGRPCGCSECVKLTLFPVLFAALAFWPELVEAETWASGSFFRMYIGLVVSQAAVWLFACRGVDILLDRWGVSDAFEALQVPFACAPIFLSCGLLHLYRSSVPEYEGESGSFSTMLHWVAAIYMLLFTSVRLALVDEHPVDVNFWAGHFLYGCILNSTQESLHALWILIVLMIVWSASIGAIGMLFHQIAEDGNAPFWWRQVFGKCGPALTCLLLLIQNGMMIATYVGSAQEDMPSAFLIEGAMNAQLNGVYHLRVDIRDGVPAVPDEPDCTDAWYTCWWDAMTSDDDDEKEENTRVPSLPEECLSELAGQYIYQAHSDLAPGSGPLLFKPIGAGTHAWIVAPVATAYASCFKSTAAYLHSVENVCALRPDAARKGSDCGQKWMEALLPSNWWLVAATGKDSPSDSTADVDMIVNGVDRAKWQHAPQVTITAQSECEEGDMCCLVSCNTHGSAGSCSTEVSAGMRVGVCTACPSELESMSLQLWSSASKSSSDITPPSIIRSTQCGETVGSGNVQRWTYHSNVTAAMSSCDADPTCQYIEDGGCDSCGIWKTCSVLSRNAGQNKIEVGHQASADGTCVYRRAP